MTCKVTTNPQTNPLLLVVPPHWSTRGDRRYFISKACDTRQGCERRRAAMQTACRRDWFNDWACVSCCIGDLCNFYVTVGIA